jgi:hypothetical protein
MLTVLLSLILGTLDGFHGLLHHLLIANELRVLVHFVQNSLSNRNPCVAGTFPVV